MVNAMQKLYACFRFLLEYLRLTIARTELLYTKQFIVHSFIEYLLQGHEAEGRVEYTHRG